MSGTYGIEYPWRDGIYVLPVKADSADDAMERVRQAANLGRCFTPHGMESLAIKRTLVGEPCRQGAQLAWEAREMISVSSYSHMCRDEHAQIGHDDSSSERCPLCRAMDALHRLVYFDRAESKWRGCRIEDQDVTDIVGHVLVKPE